MWILIIAIIVVVLIISANSGQQGEKTEYKIFDLGFDKAELSPSGSYICGHPKKDETIAETLIRVSGSEFEFYSNPSRPHQEFTIPKKKIRDIKVEDKTTVERRVTLGRFLLIGLFSLAWKKKKVNESAFIIIEWNDGRFSHETIF